MTEDIVEIHFKPAKVRSFHSRLLEVHDEQAIEGGSFALEDDALTDAIEGRAEGRALR